MSNIKTILSQFIKHDDAIDALAKDLKALHKERNDAQQAALPIWCELQGLSAAKVLNEQGSGRIVWNKEMLESNKAATAAKRKLNRLLDRAYGSGFNKPSSETDPKAKRIAAFHKAAAALSWAEFDREVAAINATR